MSTLMSAALLGTSRTAPSFDDLPVDVRSAATRLGGDPAVVLLEATALARAYRAGGAGSVTADLPAPAEDDPRLVLPESSSVHLLSMLAAKATLLDEWFALALERNFRAPDHLVAELLAYARASEVYRERILRIVGERGQWLAARNPEWSMLIRNRGGGVDGWRHGTPAERLRWLADTRRSEPAQASEELTQSWETERGGHKAAFVAALVTGLSADDVPLLERALDDRRKDVRREAATVLARLPQSPFGERMARRVQEWVRIERTQSGVRLAVEAPEEIDAAAKRDGIEDRPNPHTDYRAEYVRQAISAAPLSLWNNMIGQPSAVLNLGLDRTWEPILHDAWSTATVLQHNSEWAQAIFRTRGLSTDRRLLPMIPPRDLADLLLSGTGDANILHPDRAAIFQTLPRPWPDDITASVVAQWERAAARRADGGARSAEFSRYKYSESLRLAQASFPYSAVTVLGRAAERARDLDWQQAFVKTANAIVHRKTLLEELT
ncbi:DUF5691 domain-containing protein [Rhodococcus globerulus]|uniref:DUF5691 domain-containing protein n=1 Tax=Rhodococcus globerulus TaxID=33008 RepID=UPI003019521E